ncbi:alpha/beta hydrolase [Kineosporia sp. J2-2]|uniref:Alpha/beta hydrolase n=1 Tax=Kineosporia corallincola TaxID=2835133 RepID=A0ABS5TG53_9ACTN|nr:alpha/beta hydrolase [Kineosporia corallincola]MBT0770077.1 alpha/beta hydrolase [Kineosporia corallincola]
MTTAPLTIEQRRAGYATTITRELPDGATQRATTLGGRPALELTLAGQHDDARLLYLHGGGYIVGSPATHAGLTAELSRLTGIPAVSVDYRLAPEHPFPAAVEDGLAAYRELLTVVHHSRLVLAGDSAGAGLAVATLIAARRAGLPMPAAAVLFSPFTDLTLSGGSLTTKHGVDPIFTRASLEPFVRHYLAGHDPADELASPFLAGLTGLPPLLVQAGSSEVLLDDAVRLAARAATDEVDITLQVTPGAAHVFQNRFGDDGAADAAMLRAAAFLRAALNQN